MQNFLRFSGSRPPSSRSPPSRRRPSRRTLGFLPARLLAAGRGSRRAIAKAI